MNKTYRGCNICTHLDVPVRAEGLPGGYAGLIISPCFGCTEDHENFELDEEKLIEEVEQGLMTRREAKRVHGRMRRV